MPTHHLCDKCGTEISKDDAFLSAFMSEWEEGYPLLCNKCNRKLRKLIGG